MSIILTFPSCIGQDQEEVQSESAILPGIYQTEFYLHYLKDKKVALVVNHTSTFDSAHLLDSLINLQIDVKAIFAPEHGFRGTADAGENIDDGKDAKTDIPLYSLYGKNKKPSAIQLANPNIDRIDGPVMEPEFMSFVGLHPVPIVYGMTIGEYAYMIKGEQWINQANECDLKVIKCRNYTRHSIYEVPIAPSPNLPNHRSIRLYPSLCLFEGTTISIGRGTDRQFQLIGSPKINIEGWDESFIPKPNIGSKYPKHQDQVCHGLDLTLAKYDSYITNKELSFDWLIEAYNYYHAEGHDFYNDNNFFEKLAGTASLRAQLQQGKSMQKIRASWHPSLNDFRQMRKQYLIYQ